MKTIKVVGYYRTSGKTELQNKGFGLQTQKSEVRKMIKDNGWDLVGEYTDDGVSGTSVDRPQFQQLLIENGFDYICVYSVDRLWRDEISCSIIKHELKKMEKDVKSVREQNYSLYDENPSDFLMNRFSELLCSYEKMIITSRLSKGRKQKVLKSQSTSGKLPLGYIWKNVNNVKTVVVDEGVKEVVKNIFVSYNQKERVSEVTRKTNTRLLEIGRKTITYQTIKNILNNPLYSGVVSYGDIKIKNGSHTPIISKNLFTRCQNRLETK